MTGRQATPPATRQRPGSRPGWPLLASWLARQRLETLLLAERRLASAPRRASQAQKAPGSAVIRMLPQTQVY